MNLLNLIALKKTELIATLLVFVLILSAVLSSRLIRLTSGSALYFEEETEVFFHELGDLNDLFSILTLEDIEADETELEWAANILGWKRFQRGRYIFEGAYSYNDFLSRMTKGIQDPSNVVILPGSTPELFSESVSNKFYFNEQELLRIITDSTFLAEKDLTMEQLFGRMLPETYLMYWTTTPKNFVNRVLREFSASISEEEMNKAEEMGYSIDEILTMASIVEWEAKIPEEKARISGLYWNRIERGMRLQADPTVNYALGERRRLLFEDYQIDHPFNTYQNRGLPPGPITNPSLSTIRATLYPEDHNYLYMVANPEGGHVFTRTFEEHRAESEKWRIWLREQYRIKRQLEEEEAEDSEAS
ncbi:endolytic transglycosylase MltG [Gracilimonas halophila]|uniref:Endolytic murein transglycosylase n=1 Tax=Gracilimonas halophila TaxID=1834464 RepID=A0ABW5JL38_9BACT